MAKKEFLFNRNNVAYCTSCSSKFEPNKTGVLKESTDMNTFCFDIVTENFKPSYPPVRVVKAIPNRKIREKWIEKNFYVEVPVKAKSEDIDLFLQRVGDFEVSFKEAVGYSVKGMSKMRKGDSIRFKSREGSFVLIYGDKVDGEFEFKKDGPKGVIENVEFKSRIEVKKVAEPMGNSKGGRKDSQGRPFSYLDSPVEDVEERMNDEIASEVNTICRSDRFKITIVGIKKGSLKCNEQGSGVYEASIIAKMLSI